MCVCVRVFVCVCVCVCLCVCGERVCVRVPACKREGERKEHPISFVEVTDKSNQHVATPLEPRNMRMIKPVLYKRLSSIEPEYVS